MRIPRGVPRARDPEREQRGPQQEDDAEEVDEAEVRRGADGEAIAREEIEEDDEQQRAVRDDVGPGGCARLRSGGRAGGGGAEWGEGVAG